MASTTTSSPSQSSLSTTIARSGAKSTTEALPLEILYNLEFQHKWTDLTLHQISPSQSPPLLRLTNTDSDSSSLLSIPAKTGDASVIISGLPPRHSYIHPDFLSHLVQHDIAESDIPVQREWVIPMSIGEKWTLKRFSTVFDCLPERKPVEGFNGFKHQDSRRVLLGMLGHNGMSGDGTVVYYIMQEGDVKPRQN